MSKYIVAVPKWVDKDSKKALTQGKIVDGKNYSDERLEELTTGKNKAKQVILVEIPEVQVDDEEDNQEVEEVTEEEGNDNQEEVINDEDIEDDEGDDIEYPHHKGGGYWLLSNGDTVQGKEEAQTAQAQLDGE